MKNVTHRRQGSSANTRIFFFAILVLSAIRFFCDSSKLLTFVGHSNGERQNLVKVFYSRTRGDRSGSAILDMLMAHAFSFQSDARYGGACGNESYVTLPNQRKLIATLGLESELPFSCPTSYGFKESYRILDFASYTSNGSQIFTQKWLNYIRSKSRRLYRKSANYQIAVHVRRGDVTLCGSKFKRYFPNHYYLGLIDLYTPKTGNPYNVTIFSNQVSPDAHNSHEFKEPWSDFIDRGYDLQLGSDLPATWESMITADVLILSKSGFSYVPAIFNLNGKIVYSPYWTQPIPGWDVVSAQLIKRGRQLMRQLQKNHCTRDSGLSGKAMN